MPLPTTNVQAKETAREFLWKQSAAYVEVGSKVGNSGEGGVSPVEVRSAAPLCVLQQ